MRWTSDKIDFSITQRFVRLIISRKIELILNFKALLPEEPLRGGNVPENRSLKRSWLPPFLQFRHQQSSFV